MTSYNEWRQVIIKHFENPIYLGEINGSNVITKFQVSDTCADEINLFLVIQDQKIITAKFNGQACAIATASADLICQTITSKQKTIAIAILENYHFMIKQEEYDAAILEELIVFNFIKRQTNRLTCSFLASTGFMELIKSVR